MITNSIYECASTYLYAPVRSTPADKPSVTDRKVEAVTSSYTGKRYNKDAAQKANFDGHIDICI